MRHPHLPLIRQDISYDRKKRKPLYIAPPGRGGRGNFAPKLKAAFRSVVESQMEQAKKIGVSPHLLIKIPLAKGAQPDALMKLFEAAGLTTVGLEGREALIAFRDKADLEEFYKTIQKYSRGPRTKEDGTTPKTTSWDILEYIEIEKIGPVSSSDRVGLGLANVAGRDLAKLADNFIGIVDLELWHQGNSAINLKYIEEIKAKLAEEGVDFKILDRFIGQTSILLRVRVNKKLLKLLVEMAVVAEVDLPLKPSIHVHELAMLTPEKFELGAKPTNDGPRLCVVDSGVMANHPLLANNIGHSEAVLTAVTSPADANGHGTQVSGIAVFGDVRQCIANKKFESPITLFSARVLNDQNEFDDEKLIETQIKTAIEKFYAPPYNCRVFNMSLGTGANSDSFKSGRQTIWAETLDQIARDLNVLLVVSAGNVGVETSNAAEAEYLKDEYPKHFSGADFKLCNPATSAISLVVGAISQHDIPAGTIGADENDIVVAIAKAGQPAPFSRRGPGLSKLLKPDFVDYGGNVVFRGFNEHRQIAAEDGTAVISLSNSPTGSLFAKGFGTSFAAPLVSRKAALLEHELKVSLKRDVHPNLIRAVMACAADIPSASRSLIKNRNNLLSLVGHGKVDLDFCLGSENDNVMLIYEGEIEIDKFSVFEIPIPQELQSTKGSKDFSIAIAFDPPVRRRRADYLGVEMQMNVLKAVKADEVIMAFKKLGPKEESPTLKASKKIALLPTKNPKYSRDKCTLQKGTFSAKRISKDHGDNYFLVVRCLRKWAPQDIEKQKFAVAVSISANHDQLYNMVRQRVQVRARVRRQP